MTPHVPHVTLPWEPAPPEITIDDVTFGGVRPKLKRLRDGRVMVDAYVKDGAEIFIKAWRRADHPDLARLRSIWPNLPRAVAAPYRAENILKLMRATNTTPFLELYGAQRSAWEQFVASLPPEDRE